MKFFILHNLQNGLMIKCYWLTYFIIEKLNTKLKVLEKEWQFQLINYKKLFYVYLFHNWFIKIIQIKFKHQYLSHAQP